jgi:hypothetical protein
MRSNVSVCGYGEGATLLLTSSYTVHGTLICASSGRIVSTTTLLSMLLMCCYHAVTDTEEP